MGSATGNDQVIPNVGPAARDCIDHGPGELRLCSEEAEKGNKTSGTSVPKERMGPYPPESTISQGPQAAKHGLEET